MDWVQLEFLCEASRTVERFGLLGGKLRFPSHHVVVKILNLNFNAGQNSDYCLHVFVIRIKSSGWSIKVGVCT